MSVTFDILDETSTGERRGACRLACESTDSTLREIIRLRVQQEVERFNRSETEVFQGLIQPEETERILNGVRPSHLFLDWEKQYASAITAFQGNGFLIFVDDRQVTELDETIHLQTDTTITFLKLLPLVGG
jgi:hypothetical protein